MNGRLSAYEREATVSGMTRPPDAAGSNGAPGQEHTPVLIAEVVAALVRGSGGAFVDGTLGAGGHADAVLEAAGPAARLLGIDADPVALAIARKRLERHGPRATIVHGNFRELGAICRRHGFDAVTGVLLDLGLSSMQLADESRGFSFRAGGPLDMRFGAGSGASAAEALRHLDEGELVRVLRHFGEEPFARRIAREVTLAMPVRTAEALAAAVERAVPRPKLADALARTFQALRVYVNEELEALSEALPQAVAVLAPGGRLAVISFHSLEDRIVKQFFRRESRGCLCPPEVPRCICGHTAALRLVTRKPITPAPDEVAANTRSRSAKLRVVERL